MRLQSALATDDMAVPSRIEDSVPGIGYPVRLEGCLDRTGLAGDALRVIRDEPVSRDGPDDLENLSI